MHLNRLHLMLFLYAAFLAVAITGGWQVIGTFKDIQKNITSDTLDQHEELTRLNTALGRLLEKMTIASISATPAHLDELWLELDTTYAVLYALDLDKVKTFRDIRAEISKSMNAVEALLEAPAPFDSERTRYLADRLAYTKSDLEQIYLSANAKVVGLLRNQSQILGGVGSSIIGLLVLLFVAATLMVALLYWVRRSTQERERSAEQFRSMVESAGDAIYIHDRYGKIFSINQVACDQTGYTRDELSALSVAQLDTAIDFDNLRETWDLGEADPAAYPVTLETAHRRKDGTTFPIEVRISLLPSKDGMLYVAMVRDISERKLIQRELDFQKSALDEHAIVSIADAQGNITYINEKFCTISGYPREELLGQNHRILNSGLHPPEFFTDLWRTISSGKVWHGFIRNLRKGGGYYWVDATIVPFQDEQGKPFQYVAIRTDISARVKAVEKADKANQAKSDFLSSMSHELRTPLNAILGFGQMMELNAEEPLTEIQKGCVEHILKGGQHLLQLINDILDLAQIEAGKVEMSIEDISPTDIFVECVSIISIMAQKRGITVSIPGSGEDIPMVRADHTRLKQVVLNLMSNAVKYNRENGTISVNTDVTADNMLRIAVTDTGDGIADDTQNQLFKPFSRLGAENTEIEGTGIGLVVCKDLIELMNGTIGLESEVGKGATFWIEVPLADPGSQRSRGKIDDELAVVQATDWLPGLSGTVLYVEDNPANLRLMEMIISRIEGLTMISAHTGELGIERAKAERPDIIILDVNLPGISGLEVMKILSSEESTKDIPVLAVSAAATKRDIEKGKKAGFQRYLTKPINIPVVLDAIKTALKKSKGLS